jgi:LmbE family N-acetylglucosaminyl deacetylase
MTESASSDMVKGPLPAASRILVLAAHPDDEVVACAAAIGRAQQQGAQVMALFMTHGCLSRETLWPWQRSRYDAFVTRRRTEAEQACRFLNLTPVGFSERPARHLWRHLPEAYTEVLTVLDAHRIDQVWVPAYEGGNADHDGLNAIGQKLSPRIRVLEFAEYNFASGKAHSQEFPFSNGMEQILTLTPDEQARKKAALAIYASEQKNLGYVRMEQECCRRLAAYDYSKPPHEGTLWYARFQWVPFPHPRVDFTKADEVSKAIEEFLPT